MLNAPTSGWSVNQASGADGGLPIVTPRYAAGPDGDPTAGWRIVIPKGAQASSVYQDVVPLIPIGDSFVFSEWLRAGPTAASGGPAIEFSLYIHMNPKGAAAGYSSKVYLFYIDSGDCAYIDPSGTVTLSVAGNPVSSTPVDAGIPAPVSFNAAESVEWFVRAGGPSSSSLPALEYRVGGSGGTVVTLIPSPVPGVIPSSGSIDLLSQGDTAQFTSWVENIRVYPQGGRRRGFSRELRAGAMIGNPTEAQAEPRLSST